MGSPAPTRPYLHNSTRRKVNCSVSGRILWGRYCDTEYTNLIDSSPSSYKHIKLGIGTYHTALLNTARVNRVPLFCTDRNHLNGSPRANSQLTTIVGKLSLLSVTIDEAFEPCMMAFSSSTSSGPSIQDENIKTPIAKISSSILH